MEFPQTTNYFDIVGRAKKSYGKALEPVCRRWELTRNELDVLLFLHNNPAFDRAADIVHRRGIAKSHVSLSVTTLERRGLLLRRFTPGDRRTAHLGLTDAGAAIAKEGRAAQEAYFSKVFDGIPQEDLMIWWELMEKVRENVDRL